MYFGLLMILLLQTLLGLYQLIKKDNIPLDLKLNEFTVESAVQAKSAERSRDGCMSCRLAWDVRYLFLVAGAFFLGLGTFMRLPHKLAAEVATWI